MALHLVTVYSVLCLISALQGLRQLGGWRGTRGGCCLTPFILNEVWAGSPSQVLMSPAVIHHTWKPQTLDLGLYECKLHTPTSTVMSLLSHPNYNAFADSDLCVFDRWGCPRKGDGVQMWPLGRHSSEQSYWGAGTYPGEGDEFSSAGWIAL